MIPDPSEVDTRLLTVLAEPILPRYGAEWGKVYAETIELAKRIFRTAEQTMIFPRPVAWSSNWWLQKWSSLGTTS